MVVGGGRVLREEVFMEIEIIRVNAWRSSGRGVSGRGGRREGTQMDLQLIGQGKGVVGSSLWCLWCG